MGKQNERGTDCGLSRLLSLSQGHTPGHPWPITIENVKQMYMRVLLSPYLPYTTPPVIFFDNYVRDARTLGQWERTHTALTGLTRLTLVRRVRPMHCASRGPLRQADRAPRYPCQKVSYSTGTVVRIGIQGHSHCFPGIVQPVKQIDSVSKAPRIVQINLLTRCPRSPGRRSIYIDGLRIRYRRVRGESLRDLGGKVR